MSPRPEHPRAVGEHADRVRAVRVHPGLLRIRLDVLARLGHARRVPDGEVAEVADAAFRHNLNLALVERVELHGILPGLLGLGDKGINLGLSKFLHSILTPSFPDSNHRAHKGDHKAHKVLHGPQLSQQTTERTKETQSAQSAPMVFNYPNKPQSAQRRHKDHRGIFCVLCGFQTRLTERTKETQRPHSGSENHHLAIRLMPSLSLPDIEIDQQTQPAASWPSNMTDTCAVCTAG